MWFFFLAWVLLLGVLFNKVWEDTSEPFTKRRPPEHLMREHAWQPSKFDTDPNEFRLGTIKDILTGEDVLEVEVEETIPVQWAPANKAEAKSKGNPEAATAEEPAAIPADEPVSPTADHQKPRKQTNRKQRRRKTDR